MSWSAPHKSWAFGPSLARVRFALAWCVHLKIERRQEPDEFAEEFVVWARAHGLPACAAWCSARQPCAWNWCPVTGRGVVTGLSVIAGGANDDEWRPPALAFASVLDGFPTLGRDFGPRECAGDA